jgi:hypothetical protein
VRTSNLTQNKENVSSLDGGDKNRNLLVKNSIFWDIRPFSLLNVNRPFGRICRVHLQRRRISQTKNLLLDTCLMLVSCIAYSSTLKMEAMCSSETSGYFQRTTHRYIPENRTLHNHSCENLKFYIKFGWLVCLHG